MPSHPRFRSICNAQIDRYTMLDLLQALQVVAPVNFELIAVNLDQKQPDFPEHVLPEYLAKSGVNFKIVESDTYSGRMCSGKSGCF